MSSAADIYAAYMRMAEKRAAGALYFAPSEYACKCGQCDRRGADYTLDSRLLAYLDMVRELLGRPVLITSGWRCPAHNRACGGARRSYHLIGRAADVRAYDMTALRAVAIRVADAASPTELLIYDGYIHVAF